MFVLVCVVESVVVFKVELLLLVLDLALSVVCRRT